MIRNRRKDGSSYYVKSTVMPVQSKKGITFEYIAMRQNITAQVKKDKKLKRQRRKFLEILDHVDNIVIMGSDKERLLFANKKFYEVFKFDDFEHFKKLHDCICETFLSHTESLLPEMDGLDWVDYVLSHPEHYHKAKMHDRHGDIRTFKVDVQITQEKSDRHYIVTLSDITELEAARNAVEAAARAKGEFLANMSHEIRTPMNGIIGFTALLRQGRLEGKQKYYADLIDSSTQTLLGIINDILDFSKLESGKFELDFTPVNPFVELQKTAELFSAKIDEKQIAFTVMIDPAIPECIKIDPLRLRQVLSNLIGNAVKFTPRNGSIDYYVTVLGFEAKKVRIRFGVKDSGIGIPQAKQQHIFDAFSQADSSTTREFGGTGLGLSISQRFVSLMGGSLSLVSKESVGSNFFFDLTVSRCRTKQTLHALFERLQLSIVSDGTELTAEQRSIVDYLEKLDTPYRMIRTADLNRPFQRNELLLIFTDRFPEVLLHSSSVPVTIIFKPLESGTPYSNHIILADDIHRNYSKLYNILLNHAERLLHGKAGPASEERSTLRQYRGSVLVAEDNTVNQMLVGELLAAHGLEPTIVPNGAKAVKAAKAHRFDLILMDVNMPVMGGTEAMKTLKENGVHTPIVAVTANAMAGDRERLIGEGFHHYLAKPIINEALEKLLDLYLSTDDGAAKQPETQTAPKREAIFDIGQIRKQLPFPDHLLKKLFQSFLDSYPELLANLNNALKEEEIENIIFNAHALSGAAGNLALDTIASSARSIEHAALQNDAIDYFKAYGCLESLLKETRTEIESFLQR